jgi:hypothetical protein
MSKFTRIVATGLLALADAAPAVSSDVLNTPSWQLDYEVTFKAARQDTANSMRGMTHYDIALESTFKTGLALDMQTPGGTLSTLKSSLATQGGSAMSPAELQRMNMELIDKMGTTATWTIGGAMTGENPTPEAEQAYVDLLSNGSAGKATVNYSYVVTGKDLHTEMGTPYDLDSRTTIRGSGDVYAPAQLNFELNTKTRRFILTFAHEYSDASGTQAKKETVTRSLWKKSEPTEERNLEDVSLVVPQRIIIDEPGALVGQVLAVEGDFDPAAGKVSGERTVKAHYDDLAVSIPGTLTVRFTLTPKP